MNFVAEVGETTAPAIRHPFKKLIEMKECAVVVVQKTADAVIANDGEKSFLLQVFNK